MSSSMSDSSEATAMVSPATAPASLRWRVVDISVASVVGVVSSLIYWAAALLYSPVAAPLTALVPGLDGFMNGFWLFAGPLALVIVRKPGAGLYAEIVAAVLEAFFGNVWGGLGTVAIALAQGIGAELVFALTRYRVWNVALTTLSGAVSGLACWLYVFFTHMQGFSITGSYGIWNLVSTLIAGALIAGTLMWYLYRAIAATGALDKFASGRAVHNVNA